MRRRTIKAATSSLVLFAVTMMVSACSDQTSMLVDAPDTTTGRWYSEEQAVLGQKVYDANCINCHKARARGTFAWKKPLEDGSYPPPPLNGSAHAWHHPLSVLLNTIDEGGIPMGGKMPAFKALLSDEEKLAVIAYFQSFWEDDIYSRWLERNQPR